MTNTGSSNVTVTSTAEGVSIDPNTLAPKENATFTLPYDHGNSTCPKVKVNATTEGCNAEAAWPAPPEAAPQPKPIVEEKREGENIFDHENALKVRYIHEEKRHLNYLRNKIRGKAHYKKNAGKSSAANAKTKKH